MGDDFAHILALNEDQRIVDLVTLWHNRGYKIHRKSDGSITATVDWRKDEILLVAANSAR